MRLSHMKRLLYSVVLVLAWLGFVIEGSHAIFTASATLAGSAITTGTAELLISNSQNGSSTIYEASRPGFTYLLAPGESQDKFFLLKNTSDAVMPLDIDVSGIPSGTASDLAPQITLQFTPVDETGAPTGTPVNSQLATMANQSLHLGVTIPGGSTQRFRLTTTLALSYSQQNQSVEYDLIFTGVQHVPVA